MKELIEKIARRIYVAYMAGQYYGTFNIDDREWLTMPQSRKDVFLEQAKSILSIETEELRLAVVEKEGELPSIPSENTYMCLDAYEKQWVDGCDWMKNKILNQGWVKEHKGGE